MGILDFALKCTDYFLDTLNEGHKEQTVEKLRKELPEVEKEREFIIKSPASFYSSKLYAKGETMQEWIKLIFTNKEINYLNKKFIQEGLNKKNLIIYFTHYFLDYITVYKEYCSEEKIKKIISDEEISKIFEGFLILNYFTKENLKNFRLRFEKQAIFENDPVVAALKHDSTFEEGTLKDIEIEMSVNVLKQYIKEDQLEVLAICLCVNTYTFHSNRSLFDKKKYDFSKLYEGLNIPIEEVQEKLRKMKA